MSERTRTRRKHASEERQRFREYQQRATAYIEMLRSRYGEAALGSPFAAASTDAQKTLDTAGPPIATAVLSKNEIEEYSLLRAIHAAAERPWESASQEVEAALEHVRRSEGEV